MFRRPHSRLPPPLFRNLVLGEHPNSVGLRYSVDPFLKRRASVSCNTLACTMKGKLGGQIIKELYAFVQFSTSFLLHLPAHPVCRQTPPTLFRQRTYVSDSRSRFVKVGEGDAQSTSVADIFREGSVGWSAACASFTRGHTTCCCRDTTWCSLVETCLLLRSERGWLCCLMISFSQVVLKVHINKRLSNR